MADLYYLLLIFIGISGSSAFGTFDPKVIVEKYTTTVFVQKRSRAILDCSIRTLSPDILYSWTKDGQSLNFKSDIPQKKRQNNTKTNTDSKSIPRLHLAQNGSLIIERIVNKKKKNKNDAGFYECFAENGNFGSVIGRRIHLKIRRPAFTRVPHDLTKSVGGVARFECQDNLNSVLYVLNPYQHQDSRITSYTGILQIVNLTQADAGDYVCQTSPRLGQHIDTTLEHSATLTVNTDSLPVTPQFLNTTQIIRVLQGSPALIECLAEGQGQFQIKWTKDGVPLKEERMRVTVTGNSNIKFTRTINASDSGKYTCHLEAGDQSFEREYHLEVLVPPRIANAPRPVSTKLLVKRTRWACKAEGHPEPTISWYKDGLRLYPAPSFQLKDELVLNGQQSDSGYYQCIAENEVGMDVATAYIQFNRKPDTPDRPRNVKAIPVSATEVNVTWSPAATREGFEVMAYGVDFHEVHELTCSGKCAHLFDRKRDVSISNFKVIENLKPYTEYSFAVQGYSGIGAGLLSGEVIVRTLQAVPSTVPDVQVTADTRTSIRVKWTEIPTEHRNGVVDRYKLWHGTREKMTVLELTGDSRSYLITGLQPDTDYRVRVLAGNAAGYPEFSADKELWVEYHTPRALPKVFPMPKLTFDALNSTAVLLEWNCEDFDKDAGYRITSQKLLESGAVQEINVSAQMCQYTLTNLENNTFYKIELIVRNPDNTVIGPVTELYQSVSPGVDRQPPPPLDVDLQLLTSSMIYLEWKKPKTSLKITKFTLMYRKQTDDSEMVHLESQSMSVHLKDLSPFTWYVIAIKSHTESTAGPYSKPVIVQTKEGIPSPPENLQAEVVSPGTVKLQWGPPRKQNGIIKFYIIYYNVDKDEPDQVWNSIQQNASTTTVIVQDLKSKIYYFKLRACTNAGEGMSSHIVAIDTLACKRIPCPPCRPPQECSSEETAPPATVVTNLLQQKLGILIGCAVGLTCIICCVIFVIRYRRVSVRRGQTVSVPTNSISNSYSDNVGRYVSQPVRQENGYPRYVPMVKRLEENKNSDSKGGDYVVIRGTRPPVDQMVSREESEPICVCVPNKVCLGASCPVPVKFNEDQQQAGEPNETEDVDESSAFLTPSERPNEETDHLASIKRLNEAGKPNETKDVDASSSVFLTSSERPNEESGQDDESQLSDLKSHKTDAFVEKDTCDDTGDSSDVVQKEDNSQEENNCKAEHILNKMDVESDDTPLIAGAGTNTEETKDCIEKRKNESNDAHESCIDNGSVKSRGSKINQETVNTSNKTHNDIDPSFVRNNDLDTDPYFVHTNDDEKHINSACSSMVLDNNENKENIKGEMENAKTIENGHRDDRSCVLDGINDNDKQSINSDSSRMIPDSEVHKGDIVVDTGKIEKLEDCNKDRILYEMCNENDKAMAKVDGVCVKDVKDVVGIEEAGKNGLSEQNTCSTDQGDLNDNNDSEMRS